METRIAFASVFMFAAFAAAARVPIDTRFIVDGEREVRGWTFNKVESYKPFGDIAACMLDGVPGVRLVSKGKPTSLYHTVPVKVKPGETCVLKAKARGKGKGSLGFFAYGPRWAWKGSHGTPFENAAGLNASPLPVEAKFVVPEGVETVRPILSAPGGSEVEFFDVTFEKE